MPASAPANDGKLFTVTGESMQFLLSPGDQVLVQAAKTSEIRAGEIVMLAVMRGGQPATCVVHRVTGVQADGKTLSTKGDSAWNRDPDSGNSLVIGRVSAIKRAGRWFALEPSPAQKYWRVLSAYSPVACLFFRLAVVWEMFFLKCLLRALPARAGIAAAAYWSGLSDQLLRPLLLSACGALPRLLLAEDSRSKELAWPSEAAARRRVGQVARDEIWEGTVIISGDLVINPGVRVAIRPGTKIIFEKTGAPWRHPLFHPGSGEKSEDSARLLIYGALTAEASDENPIEIDAAQGGVLHFLGGAAPSLLSRVRLTGVKMNFWHRSSTTFDGCRLELSSGGLRCLGLSALRLKSCSVSISGGALLIQDSSRVSGEDCSFSLEGGLSCLGRGDLRLKSCSLALRGVPMLLQQSSRADCQDCSFSFSESSLRLAGSADVRARRTTLQAASGVALSLEQNSKFDGEELAISSLSGDAVCAAGESRLILARSAINGRVAVSKAFLCWSHVALSAEGGDGLDISAGTALELRDCSVSAGRRAVAADSSRLRVRRSSFTGQEAGLSLRHCLADLAESVASAPAGQALTLAGGEMTAVKSEFSGLCAVKAADGARFSSRSGRHLGQACGIEFFGGRLTVYRGMISAERGAALDLHGGGAHRIEDADVRGALQAVRADASRLRARHSRFSGQEAGLQARHCRLSALDCAVSSAAGQALTLLGGEMAAVKSRFNGLRLAVKAEDGARFSLRGGACSGKIDAIEASRGSSIELRDCSVSAGRHAVASDSSRLRARRSNFSGEEAGLKMSRCRCEAVECLVSAPAGRALALSGGEMTAVKSRFRGLHSAVSAESGARFSSRAGSHAGQAAGIEFADGQLRIDRGAISAESGIALDLRGGGPHRIDGADVRGAMEAVRADASRLRLRRSSLRSQTNALTAKNSDVILIKTLAAGGQGCGLKSLDAKLLLHSSQILGELSAIESRNGQIVLRGGQARSVKGAALYLRGRGPHILRDILLSGSPNINIKEDTHISGRYATAGGRKIALRVLPPEAAAPRWQRALRKIMFETRHKPLAVAACRRFYRLAIAAFKRLAAACGGVTGLAVYRDWGASDWDAGVSGLDFQLVLDDRQDPAAQARAMRNFWTRHRWWRKIFPLGGEVLAASRAELRDYLADGGGRACEFARQSTWIHGLPETGPQPAPNAIADLTDAFHDYTRMMSLFFDPSQEDPARHRENMRRALLDVLRHCQSALSQRPPEARADCRQLADLEPLSGLPLSELGSASCALALRRLTEASALIIESREQAPATPTAIRRIQPRALNPLPQAQRKEAAFQRAHAQFCRDFGFAEVRFSFDNMHRFYVILPDGAGPWLWESSWPAIAQMREKSSIFGALPIILSETAWEFLSSSSYLHHPTAFLDRSLGGWRATGGLGLTEPFEWKTSSPAARREVSDAWLRAAGRQSLLHLGISWRSILFDASAQRSLHHLYTRTLGLRLLLEAGVAHPFSSLDLIQELSREHLPDTRRWLAELDLSDDLRGGTPLRHYAFLQRQITLARGAAPISDAA